MAKAKTNKKAKKKKGFWRTFWKIIWSTILITVPLVILLVLGILWYIFATTEPIDVENLRIDLNSSIYYLDEDGDKHLFEEIDATQNRDWVDYTEVPQYMKDAFVSIEDERFFSHTGFDLKRTTKAIIDYARKGSGAQGGSTITQQLVKNVTNNKDLTPRRKIEEIWLAYQLEQDLSKEQILELYMNTIYLAQGVNGVQTAAELYFDKDVSDLSLAECASIAGITQFPSRYDPFVNPDKNKEKQELVLKKMLETGKITQAEYDEAEAEELVFADPEEQHEKNNIKQTYMGEVVIKDAIRLLMEEQGITEAVAKKRVYSGGYQIISTVDPNVQDAIDDTYSSYKAFGESQKEVMPQSAIVVMDPQTGYVKGLTGGIGEREGSYTLNRAVDTYRQPGSCMKPLAVYAPALEAGLITPNTQMVDKKLSGYSPKNYYSGYYGTMSVQRAVELSVNTIPVQIIEDLGYEESYNFLRNKFHIDSIVEADKNPALALGGITDGVNVMDMTAAYAAFANNGIYTEPTTVLEILDHHGRTVVKANPESTAIMKETTAQYMHQMLISVVNNGTGTAARISGVKVGGKTGSTDGDKDRWFVGYTPNYVAAVWYGYDTPKPTSYSYNPALKGWKAVMDEIMEDAPKRDYATKTPTYIPPSTSSIRVCSVSNKLPCQYCIDQGTTVTRSFRDGAAPTTTCSKALHEKFKEVEPKNTPKPTEEDLPETTATPAPSVEYVPEPTKLPSLDNSHDNDNSGLNSGSVSNEPPSIPTVTSEPVVTQAPAPSTSSPGASSPSTSTPSAPAPEVGAEVAPAA
ncbi:MAG: PBP1A family penicillin-binding protein [Ruminococcaceae bacterium]|nr:PBP1A family penicillin-binding protein [Oscillospiraceae bacterium]